MATNLDGNLVLLMLFLMIAATNLPMSNANIAHFDEYWKNKAKLARSAIMKAYRPEPYNVTNHLNHHAHLAVKENLKSNTTRRSLAKKYKGPCLASNPIDQCWRCSKDWEQNRMRLADCGLGFGRETTGGKGGKIYEVIDHSDDDVLEPKPGTLRHAVIQKEPLWIIFKRPMKIKLKQELMVASNKTIDARGSNVHITGGCGITIQFVQNVIIHGLHIHDIKPGSGGMIRDSVDHFGQRTRSDGDGVSIFGACHVWVDHVSLSKCTDGLIDAIEGSTAITISNCHMSNHNDVFLFGAMDTFKNDKMMQVTVAFNHFGKGLVQRMPRCRWGFFHVVNNDYTHWLMYAIGGSRQPTILSQGNRFIAPPDIKSKEVTKREEEESVWKNWNWRSEEDLFLNGAFFRQSGTKVTTTQYGKFMIKPQSGKHVRDLARMSGPRSCKPGHEC